MASFIFVIPALTLLPIHSATAFRVRSGGKRVSCPESTQGGVDALYTYGAPGCSSPGFYNPTRSDGCFPGLRAWAGRKFLDLTGTADQVGMLTVPLGYRHPMQDSAEFDVRGSYTVRKEECSYAAQGLPWYRLGDVLLHLRTGYKNVAETISEEFGNLTDMATFGSYFGDLEYIKLRSRALGWRYVSMATHPGNTLNGGPQQVHLVQHPQTLECLMTFQGSHSPQDWVSNLAVAKSHFCGFVDRDEECPELLDTGVCQVKKLGHTFVHLGFRDHLRRMVRSDEFQENIRPLLPGCAKLQVAGHSLGGAMSTLFTACTNKAPQPGEYGYEEDYMYINYTRGTPRQLW